MEVSTGCGPGRHAVGWPAGDRVVGVDISERFLEVADERADAAVADLVEFHRAGAALRCPPFDAAVSLCEARSGSAVPERRRPAEPAGRRGAARHHSARCRAARAVSALVVLPGALRSRPTGSTLQAVNHERTG